MHNSIIARLALNHCLLPLFHPYFHSGERGYDIWEEDTKLPFINPSTHESSAAACVPFLENAFKDVATVLKFGAAEVASKLPTYLSIIGPCAPDMLLFSDTQRTIMIISYTTHSETSPLAFAAKMLVFFLPMMQLVWDKKSQNEWFVFIELDTYVNWANLHRFLRHFDPSQSHYFGSPVWLANRLLVTYGKKFRDNDLVAGSQRSGKDLSKECCGEVLAQVLTECRVTNSGYWPMFNGEKSTPIWFGKEHYCEAIITLHHLNEADFAGMQRWEAARERASRPLTFEELFEYTKPSLQTQIDHWTNMSEDVTRKALDAVVTSFNDCFEACLKDRKCVRYEHFGDTCGFSYTIRMGHEKQPEGSEK
ncbi:glycosyltransferase family 31 protein [Zopfia rhizophila CBS 207.26]|uniref:N-acetylgalactosaminide beta-1,3-galactosyltransferase n=1 Tax=Zopfia rhizophila CBS 207.26 TaxID=1314779 RepID=A0A6A6ELE4_9PEZI|nr:glycosyltransferase family 31 protein [Zopfia rhizophila CBS 207.26]